MEEISSPNLPQVENLFVNKVILAIKEKRLKPDLGRAILESMGLPGEKLIRQATTAIDTIVSDETEKPGQQSLMIKDDHQAP
jgi:hypothetical protein